MSYCAYEPLYLRPHHQHQPAPEYGGGGGLKDGSINTLFVSGLPDDVKPREIHNLFRRRSGFDSCQLKYTGVADQVVAFVTFFNHQSAVAALHALNGVTFDPFSGEVLHIELARSNSRRKRRPGSSPYVVIDKRRRYKGDSEEASSHDGDDNNKDAEKEDSADEDISGEEAANTDDVPENEKVKKTEEDGAAPCSTLFIASLGPNCLEEELEQALSQYPGFNALKIRARGGMPVAFADFEEVEQAAAAKDRLQGTTLPSSDRGGLVIE
ncbi:RNA-binding protein with multiple splicing 2-like protein [Drosera capensis]